MSSQEILNALQFAVTPICVRLKHLCLREVGTFLVRMKFMRSVIVSIWLILVDRSFVVLR